VGLRQGTPVDPGPLNRDSDNCMVCSGRRLVPGVNDLASTHPEVAAQADGWDPTTVRPGSNTSQRWRCKQGHTWPASVISRTLIGSGCPGCAEYGFNSSRPATLYVVESETHDLYKFGITNTEGHGGRVHLHNRRWGAVLRWEVAGGGEEIQAAERIVKQWKREAGIPDGIAEGSGRTETVPRSLVTLEELVAVCHEALERVRQGGTGSS